MDGSSVDSKMNAEDAPETHAAVVAKSRLVDRAVLVVDDDLESLQMAVTAISATGALVYTADSAAAGVTVAASIRPSAIVCDISMPNEDGFGFLRRLRLLDGLSSVPAIALTAHARDEDKAAVLRAGFCMHLAKPVDPRDLVRAVAEVAG
jgi:CheY-like chemotaxis protein